MWGTNTQRTLETVKILVSLWHKWICDVDWHKWICDVDAEQIDFRGFKLACHRIILFYWLFSFVNNTRIEEWISFGRHESDIDIYTSWNDITETWQPVRSSDDRVWRGGNEVSSIWEFMPLVSRLLCILDCWLFFMELKTKIYGTPEKESWHSVQDRGLMCTERLI